MNPSHVPHLYPTFTNNDEIWYTAIMPFASKHPMRPNTFMQKGQKKSLP